MRNSAFSNLFVWSNFMALETLILNPQAERRIRKGHLWVYSNEVDGKKNPLTGYELGQQVQVVSAKGQVLGAATLNPQSLICGRIYSRNGDQELSKSFLAKRIEQALTLREAYFDKPYYRLVYGDSDFLPGVIADRYGDYLVVQIATAGMEAVKDELLRAFDKVLAPKGIVVANDHSARSLEGLPEYVETVGEVPEYLRVEENGTQFDIPSSGGQKTGWFYDHRVNRAELQKWVKGKTVLDVFSYAGGWGVEAANAGAESVTCVDASEQALDLVERAAELNGCDDKVMAIQGKAIHVLKLLIEEQQKYDVVVLDPPAFIKRKKDQKSGEAAYRHINELAMRLLKRGGLLVSGSCSMHLANSTLTDIVRAAAVHLDRDVQLVYSGVQAPDHPQHPAIPETHYLKAQFFRVLHR